MAGIYFVSDVHMRPHFARRASFFTHFLHSIRGAQAVYMLGDIFDYWVGVGQLRKALADPVFRALRTLHLGGTKLYFVGGNRDFLVGRELTRVCGVEVLGDTASVKIGDLKVHLSHGDQFCTRDSDYMLFRTAVRNPVLMQAFKLFVPLFVRLYIAKLLRHSSKTVVKKKAKKVRDINLVAVERAFRKGHEVVVCGHIHQPRHLKMGIDRDFYVLGHWDEGPNYLVYENESFRFVPELKA